MCLDIRGQGTITRLDDTHDPHSHLIDTPPCVAAAALPVGDLVHTVFGASKDFCGSGLRVGVLYSKNAALNTALGNLGYFASVPAPLQMSLSKLVTDDAWLDSYLAENRRRMLEAYTQLAGVAWYGVLCCAVVWRGVVPACLLQQPELL